MKICLCMYVCVSVRICIYVCIRWFEIDDNFLALIKVRYHHYNHDHQEKIKTAAK
jgi:hypothetical protein